MPVNYAQVPTFQGQQARSGEDGPKSTLTSCSYGQYADLESYTSSKECAAGLAKLQNWDSEVGKQARTKLQNVLNQAADLNAEHHALLDHNLFHAKLNAVKGNSNKQAGGQDNDGGLLPDQTEMIYGRVYLWQSDQRDECCRHPLY